MSPAVRLLFAVGLVCFAPGCTRILPNGTNRFRAAVTPVLRTAGSLRERLAFEARPGSADEKPWDRYLADGRVALDEFRKEVLDLPEPESKELRAVVVRQAHAAAAYRLAHLNEIVIDTTSATLESIVGRIDEALTLGGEEA